MTSQPFGEANLDPRIRARQVPGVNGLDMHILEAGFEVPGRPAVLLLHGFPELAYSWRHQLVALAEAGYHAIAPDQRGYGGTTGWDRQYACNLSLFRMLNLVTDAVQLVSNLGYRTMAAVVGHDFGSPVAAWCALIWPDVFERVMLMSAPFAGAPEMPKTHSSGGRSGSLMAALAELDPPRKHYQWYFATPAAEGDLLHSPQGLHQFLREYYHVKSADWTANQPHELAGWTPEAMAALPRYYVMDLDRTMPETTAALATDIAPASWLPDEALAVYVDAYQRTGFQGGLNWYRCSTDPALSADLALFAGRTIDVPAAYVAGAADWGMYQSPGALARMQEKACSDMRGVTVVAGAGHWVQQEQPARVNRLLLDFLAGVA
ncbi:MAG: alpha/beta fold hydrolase [Pseudomonadota bacterium]